MPYNKLRANDFPVQIICPFITAVKAEVILRVMHLVVVTV